MTDYQGLSAFNASDGSLAWRIQREPTAALAAVANGDVYIGDASSLPGSIIAFSASDGKQQWQGQPSTLQPAAQALLSLTPSSTGIVFLVAAGGAVYVSHDNVTIALDGSNGKQLWRASGTALLVG